MSICTRSERRTTKRIRKLSEKRNRKVRNALHHMSKLLVGHACKVGASAIVIGYNKGWKQKVKLGRKTNQGFVQIPYHTLLKQIAYKSEENGIKVVLQNESYTSMCSFLDSEPIERHGRYKGRRICRGLFRSENGKVINADVNAAYNIIKKAFPKAFAEGIEDVSLHPARMAH
ncbi:MAG: IS200/IS605 family accessory protein TnpB-related protein, partial [Candidatus Methanofastidiosia archaeon]